MSLAPTRLLVLGIDAASPDLLEAWIADGTLPNLAAIVRRGVSGRTRGLEGFFVGSTWPSLYTGTNPAKHGFHYQMQLRSGSYDIEDRAQGAFVERDPFWRTLSSAGKRVAVLDVPLTRLEPELQGVQVVEWGGHDSFFGFSTIPPELASHIEASVGRHPTGATCDASGRGAAEYRELVASLEEGVRRKTEWTRELLLRGDWDLFMQVFTESHCVGHQCWHLHDEVHPAHDRAMAALTGDPMRAVYRAIDRAIGEIVHAAGDARVVVFSAHGMSHRHGAHFLLRDILFALDAAARPPVALRERVHDVAASAWSVLPSWMRALAAPLRRRVAPTDSPGARALGIGVDPVRSRCFAIANGLAVSGIRLNIAGREPSGVLHEGAELERFVAQLERDLLDIHDDVSGAPLVKRVLRVRELFDGEKRDALPDLLVEWSESVAVGSTSLNGGAGARVVARSDKIGMIDGANDYARSGEHRAGGWFAASGAGIATGRLTREVSLLDLAPTFARVLGVDLCGADGSAIPEIAIQLEASFTSQEPQSSR